MSRHLVFLPAPEAESASCPPRSARRACAPTSGSTRLRAGGHRLVAAGPLRPSAEAVSLPPTARAAPLVTDGPFAESVEQVVGFYLVETDDREGLLAACRRLSSTGDLVEFRDLLQDGGADEVADGVP